MKYALLKSLILTPFLAEHRRNTTCSFLLREANKGYSKKGYLLFVSFEEYFFLFYFEQYEP
jgi:hypothetical protein